MAQTNYTPIQLYHSTTGAAAPTSGNLVDGELGINITDGKLFYKDNLGAVQVLATKAGASGDVVGPASSTDNALVRFDATTGKLVQNSVGLLSDTGDLTGLNSITLITPLGVASGGTGSSSTTFVNLATNVTGTLPVANGGTGAATLTSNNVLLGNGTSAVQTVAPGTAGNVLTSNGTTWTAAALPAGGLTYIFTTTPVTATDKQGVLTDTSGGAFTVTLPATPSVGAQVVIADAGSNWGTNNLTVGRNSSTIGGLAEDLVCNINGASVQFVYDGTTWEVYAQVGGNGGTVVTLTGTQTLTNKTLTAPVITTPIITQNVQVISTNTTAVASRTYVLTASLTLTLPLSPAAGDWVAVQNSSGTTTAVIARNGSNIMSLAENLTLDADFVAVTLVYADATRGWVFN